MLKMSVKRAMANLNVVDSRPHLNDEGGYGRQAGSVRQARSEDLGLLNHYTQRVEHIISCPIMLWFVCL